MKTITSAIVTIFSCIFLLFIFGDFSIKFKTVEDNIRYEKSIKFHDGVLVLITHSSSETEVDTTTITPEAEEEEEEYEEEGYEEDDNDDYY